MPSSANLADSCSLSASTIFQRATSERHVQWTVNNGFDSIVDVLSVRSLPPTLLSTLLSTFSTSPNQPSSTSVQHTREATVSTHPRMSLHPSFVFVKCPSLM